MSTRNRPHLDGIMQPSEGHELPEVGSISALRFLILDVGKPFELRWNSASRSYWAGVSLRAGAGAMFPI